MWAGEKIPTRLSPLKFFERTKVSISHGFVVTLQYGATAKGIFNILR